MLLNDKFEFPGVCSAPTNLNVCETWIMMWTQMLTCFDSQQSLIIPCQQLQWFFFVFYQTALSLSVSTSLALSLSAPPPRSVCGCDM